MKSLMEYLNYRRFLQDYYKENKEKNKYFSYRYFAQKANIRSPNLLKQVIEGDRNLTRVTMENFAEALRLDERDTKFFQHLVQFNQARTPAEKQESYTRLREMVEGINPKLIPRNLYDYFDKWYNVVIRELVCMYDFRDDFKKIAQSVSPRIKPLQAKKSVQLLLEIGMIKKLKDGRYRQKNPIITTEDEVKSMVLRKFNSQMIQYARESLDRHPLENRHISGITMGVSRNSYELIVKETQAYKERVLEIVNDEKNPDNVYQLNVQLFPVSQVKK